MVSTLDAEDEWKARIQQNFGADCGDAYRDSDHLMQGLLDSEIDTSGVLSFQNPYISWELDTALKSIIEDYKHEPIHHRYWSARKLPVADAHGPEKSKSLTPASMSCLYQLRKINKRGSIWKMGIATGKAKTGDLICCIPELKKAVVIRVNSVCVQIIGTAVGTTRDSAYYFSSSEYFKLFVDAETAYILVS